MNYKKYSYKEAELILKSNDEYKNLEQQLLRFNEEKLIYLYEKDNFMSLAKAIRRNFEDCFREIGWNTDKYLFKDSDYMSKRWSNNFYKDDLVLNIAFDHNISICWNLVKGELASNPNIIEKNGFSRIQILITATKKFMRLYGFDSAVGSYEDYIKHLKPLSNILNFPILVIGLDEMESFKIQKVLKSGRNKGHVIQYK